MHRTASPRIVQLTPPGRGAVATLRVEGPGATALVEGHFQTRSGQPLRSFTIDRPIVGRFGDEEIVARRCEDDAVELHCHGGLAAVAMLKQTLIAAGCRHIPWQEWIANRHADPIASAALAALADAPTERTAAILLDQRHGALRRAIDAIDRAMGSDNREAAEKQIDALLAYTSLGRHLIKPWRVVLAGRVNVGKSSLINAMAGYGRSIVHHTPGTTRDAVTLTTAIDGWPVELCDTAGLRVGQDRSTIDAIEREGIERAHERLAAADLAILVFDASATWSASDQALLERWPNTIMVHNKCDLLGESSDRPAGIMTSAIAGVGLQELLETIARRLVPTPPSPGEAVPFTDEQISMLERRRSGITPA